MSRPTARRSIVVHAVLALSAVLVATGSADAQSTGFTWFINPGDISPGTTGSWQDIGLSTLVSAGATGVMVEIHNSSASTVYKGVVRGKRTTGTICST